MPLNLFLSSNTSTNWFLNKKEAAPLQNVFRPSLGFMVAAVLPFQNFSNHLCEKVLFSVPSSADLPLPFLCKGLDDC